MNITIKLLEKINYMDICTHAVNADDTRAIADVAYFYRKHSRNNKAVLNAILLHSMQLKRGTIPNIAYLQKALYSWLDKNRNTARKAVAYLRDYEEYKKDQDKKKETDISPELQAELDSLEDGFNQ